MQTQLTSNITSQCFRLSPAQLYNHLTVPVNLYVKTAEVAQYAPSEQYTRCEHDPAYTLIQTVQPDTAYSVPLLVAYHCKMFAQPSGTM